MMFERVRVALFVTGILVAAACTTHYPLGPTAAPGAISEEAAIAAAKSQAPPTTVDPSVIWVHVDHDPFVTSDPALVWEVRLQAPFALPTCPPEFLDRYPQRNDAPCLDQDGGLVAVLDHYSGALLGWIH